MASAAGERQMFPVHSMRTLIGRVYWRASGLASIAGGRPSPIAVAGAPVRLGGWPDDTEEAEMPASQAGFGKVVVVGQGYVGLPLAMRAVDVGWTVVGLDVDEHRVKRLNAGESYVEDVPSAELSAAIESGRYQASVEPAACIDFDVAVITVPTPLRDGAPDLSFIEEGTATVARYLRPGATVVLESTTYPGTTEELVAPILEAGSGLAAGVDFHLGYSPERIDPGNRTLRPGHHAQGGLGHRRRLPGRGAGLLRLHRRPHGAGVEPQGGGDDQAAGEHVPARQHRPGQRAEGRERRSGEIM